MSDSPHKAKHHIIAPEGYPFLAISFVLIPASYFLFPLLVVLPILLFFFIVNFFRNPRRTLPEGDNNLISPADGRIIFIDEVQEDRFLKGKVKKISIFMSPLDVHMNRIPLAGTIENVSYNKGKFLKAYAEKASLHNEQNALVIKSEKGDRILFIQIAGFIARRIVCYAEVGQTWKQGEIFGMIRFGSRMDLYFPTSYDIKAKMGEYVYSGETILAQL